MIPESKRRKCIFRESCSRYVYNKIINEGFFSGLKALQYRHNNCRAGFHIFKNPVTEKTNILLPNYQILEQSEIAERFIINK